MPSLPSIVSPLPNDVRQFLLRVKESFSTDVVTKDALIKAGIVSSSGGSLTAPPAQVILAGTPENVQVSAAVTSIFVTWNAPNYVGHAYAEVWRADSNSISLAQLVGQAAGHFFADPVGYGQTKYYWVRFVSESGNIGAYNSQNGTSATTPVEVTHALAVLNGQISSSQLATNLNTTIGLITAADTVTGSVAQKIKAYSDSVASTIALVSAADTVSGSVAQRVKTAQDSLQAQINDLTNTPAYDAAHAYSSGNIVTYSGGLYQANSSTTGNVPTNTTYWTKLGDYTSLGAAVADAASKISAINTVSAGSSSAAAQAIASVTAKVDSPSTGLAAAFSTIVDESNARVSADSALASTSSALTASVGANLGAIQSEATTRAASDSVQASKIDTVAVAYGSNAAAIQTETTARATDTSSLASQITLVNTSTANNSAAVTSESTARTTETSSLAQQISAVSSATGGNMAGILAEATTRASETAAVASQIIGVATKVGDNASAIQGETTARSSDTSALAQQISTIGSSTANASSSIASVQTTTAASDAALASQLATISAATGPALAAVQSEVTARTTDTSSLAATAQTIQSSLGVNHSAIQVQATSIDGLSTQFTVKASSDGYIGGFGFASEPSLLTGVPTFYFKCNVNYFTVGQPGSTAVAPFYVKTVSDAVSPAGTYISSAFIENASITNAKIADATIQSAKIFDLDAGKITSGFISSDRIEAGSIAATKINTDGLEIKDSSGNVIFKSGTTAKIAASAIAPDTTWVNGTITKSPTQPTTCSLGDIWIDTSNSAQPVTWIGAPSRTAPATPYTLVQVRDEVLHMATGGGAVIADLRDRLDDVFSGRVIADINNDGSITATGDWAPLAIQVFGPSNNSQQTQDYINNVLLPYVNGTNIAWVKASNLTTDTSQLTDGAGLGTTAVWASVSGSGKPSDGATKNVIFRQSAAPSTGMTGGDFWVKTTTPYAIYQYDGTNWIKAGDLTSENTAAAITGQGALATVDQITKSTASTYIANGAIGTAQIDDATITTAKIASEISSTNYAAGVSGWKINKDGTAEFQNATVAGNVTANSLNAATGTFTGSLTGATGTFAGSLQAGVIDLTTMVGQSTTYTTPGTYTITVPSNLGSSSVTMRMTLQGAGGSGNVAAKNDQPGGSGGGAGQKMTVTLSGLTAGATYTLVVGSGAPSYTVGNSGGTGANGGSTSLAGYTATGGTAGGGVPVTISQVPDGFGGFTYDYHSPSGTSGGEGAASLWPAAGGVSRFNGPGGLVGGNGSFGSGGGVAYRGGPERDGTDGSGAGGDGAAIVEFFNPNAVVLRATYGNLVTWLDAHVGTVPSNAR